MLTRSKARLAAKRKKPLTTKQLEYCDGRCQNSLVNKGNKAKTKQTPQKQNFMSASQNPENHTEGSEVLVAAEGAEQNLAPTSTTMPVTFDELSKLLIDQNEHHATQWQKQLNALAKTIDKAQPSVPPSGSNNIKFPSFSGDGNSDVNSFIRNLNLTGAYHNMNSTQKANLLPLLLTGTAQLWFHSATHLSGKSYEELCDALVQQFHTEADMWVLKQQIANRKQMPNETVAQFASDIRSLGHRLNLPSEQNLNTFVQGLRPGLKNYVVLQRPKTFAEAENLAKLKETLPDDRPVDRTDEILKAIALSKTTAEPKIAAYNTPFTSNNASRANHSYEKPLGRDEITQIITQELRRSRNQQTQGQDYRNRRTFDGKPICNYCKKVGHIAYVCRKRQFDNRDPRIPVPPERQLGQSRRPQGDAANPAFYDQPNLN